MLVPALAAAFALAACNDDVTGPEVQDVVGQLTVDATTDSVFVALDETAQVASGSTWDVGFFATAVFLRQSGSPVLALCLCQNEGATDEQVIAMTADSEEADFEAVTAAQIPAPSDPRWSSTAFDASRWYRYDIAPEQPHHIHPTFDVYLVKKGTSVYKLQILNYYDAANDPRYVTFRYQRIAQ